MPRSLLRRRSGRSRSRRPSSERPRIARRPTCGGRSRSKGARVPCRSTDFARGRRKALEDVRGREPLGRAAAKGSRRLSSSSANPLSSTSGSCSGRTSDGGPGSALDAILSSRSSARLLRRATRRHRATPRRSSRSSCASSSRICATTTGSARLFRCIRRRGVFGAGGGATFAPLSGDRSSADARRCARRACAACARLARDEEAAALWGAASAARCA